MADRADIDLQFYETAAQELEKLGVTAIEFMRRHPVASKAELAKALGNGVAARGLTMKLFEEARENGETAALAKELLYRKILAEFPLGWYENEEIRPTVKLGGWHYDLLEFAPEDEPSAACVLRALASTSRPSPGWKPIGINDDLLRLVFEENWA